MVAFNKFNQFVGDLANGLHALGTDTLNVMLTNPAPAASNITKGNITEIAGGNGYTTNGAAPARTSSTANSSGTYSLVLANLTFTASGGSIGPFRYPVLYNFTKYNANNTANVLVGYWDYGSSVTLATGETFTVGFDPVAGVLQLA